MAEGDYIITITHGAGTVVHDSTAPGNAIMSFEYDRAENQPATLVVTVDVQAEVPALNILSGSFAGWSSGTGALEIGDLVDLQLCTTAAPTTYTALFHGTVTAIAPGGDEFSAKVTAADRLAAYQGIGRSLYKTFFANYRDQLVRKQALDATLQQWVLTAPAGGTAFDATLLLPCVSVKLANNFGVLEIGDSLDADSQAANNKVAMQFIASRELLTGVQFYYKDASTTPNITWGIYAVDASGYPTGAALYTKTLGESSTAGYLLFYDWVRDASNNPTGLQLIAGKMYALVIQSSSATTYIALDTTSLVGDITQCLYYSGGAWSVQASKQIRSQIVLADLSELDTMHYYWDAANSRICVPKSGLPGSMSSAPGVVVGSSTGGYAFVSYYYGTVAISSILGTLIGLGPCTAAVSGSIAKALSLYRTRGRYVSDCLSELAEIRETSGAFSGSQYAIAHARVSGTDYIYANRRLNLSDGSYRTFSHPADDATVDNQRIISCELQRTIKGRPTTCVVTGRDSAGNSIMATVSDLSLSGGGFSGTSGIESQVSITDSSLQAVSDCIVAGYAKLDTFIRDSWEGPVAVDGVFPDLFDLGFGSSTTAGSGRIVTLNWSPKGIVAQKFKVKAVHVGKGADRFVTRMQLSNHGILVLNPFSDTSVTTLRSESFISPTDAQYIAYAVAYSPNVVSLPSPCYMELQTAAGAAIPGSARAVCTVFSNTSYNQKAVHAQFAVGQGTTVDGSPIGKLALFAAASGGSAVDSITLATAQQFPKWSTTGAIVDYLMPIA